MDKTYNGWSNWETWNVALWLDNTEKHYLATKGMNAPMLKAYVTEQFINHNGFGDLHGRDELKRVDWYEIASNHND